MIPKNLKEKIRGLTDIRGNAIRDLHQFEREYRESFKFKFVDVDDLTKEEKQVFEMTEKIFSLIGGKPSRIKEVKISETMLRDFTSGDYVKGIWDPLESVIIIKRDVLRSLEEYAGTLLHETAHAISGAEDVSREFEDTLTSLLGKVVKNATEKQLK